MRTLVSKIFESRILLLFCVADVTGRRKKLRIREKTRFEDYRSGYLANSNNKILARSVDTGNQGLVGSPEKYAKSTHGIGSP